jgi:S-(hydroxymethyl)glutathione dehydrogenase/alcohol dehydrogenase
VVHSRLGSETDFDNNVLLETNKPLQIMELTIPELRRGQVLVKVVCSGLCHTQLNEIRGRKGKDKWLPHTLGHEGSGEVVDTGPGVTKVEKGDMVIMTWINAKGLSAEQISYTNNGTKINSGPVSTFSDYTVVSENKLVKVPAEIPMDIASLLGCAVTTGAGIILNTLKAGPESTVAVIGAGGIGMSSVIGAGIAGCRKIIAVDISDFKLDMAKDMGATDIVNAQKENVVESLMNLTDGSGVDYVVEAANSGTVVIAGNLAHGEKIEIDPFDLIKGKKIIGTWGGETRPDEDIVKYLELYKKSRLDLSKLITHRFRLEEINEAFGELEEGKVGRAVIEI